MRLHQTKKFLHLKGKHQQNKKKRHPMGWENIFADISDKGFYIELKNTQHQENIQLKNWQRT